MRMMKVGDPHWGCNREVKVEMVEGEVEIGEGEVEIGEGEVEIVEGKVEIGEGEVEGNINNKNLFGYIVLCIEKSKIKIIIT